MIKMLRQAKVRVALNESACTFVIFPNFGGNVHLFLGGGEFALFLRVSYEGGLFGLLSGFWLIKRRRR